MLVESRIQKSRESRRDETLILSVNSDFDGYLAIMIKNNNPLPVLKLFYLCWCINKNLKPVNYETQRR